MTDKERIEKALKHLKNFRAKVGRNSRVEKAIEALQDE